MIRRREGVGRRRAWAPLVAGLASGSLFASSLWVPPLGFLLSLLSPLPLAVESWRGGLKATVTATLTAVVLVSALGGAVGGGIYLTQFASAGCVLGLTTRKKRSPPVVVGSYAFIAVCSFWAALAWFSSRAELDLLTFLTRLLTQNLDQAAELLLQGNQDAQATLAVQAWAEQTRVILVQTFPGLHAILAMLTGWSNALILRRIVAAKTDDPWILWRAPEYWIWLLILCGLGTALAPLPWRVVALNVFFVTLAVYFLQGLAVVQFLFENKGLPPVFRVAAYTLLVLQLPMLLLVAGVGAFDMWFDFRSRLTVPPDQRAPRQQ